MKILEFDINKGVYNFELGAFSTLLHRHPAVEIILSTRGKFSVATEDRVYSDLMFALIDANVAHKVLSEDCEVNLLMVECDQSQFQDFLRQNDMLLEDGIFVEKTHHEESNLLHRFRAHFNQNTFFKTDDERINICLDYFRQEQADYKQMMPILQSKVHLSESRLSHLFKEKIGISLKKYLVWTRLKNAFYAVLEENITMYDAALQSGFYDQAHLSKAFKELLGINPSEVYNSRTLQK